MEKIEKDQKVFGLSRRTFPQENTELDHDGGGKVPRKRLEIPGYGFAYHIHKYQGYARMEHANASWKAQS